MAVSKKTHRKIFSKKKIIQILSLNLRRIILVISICLTLWRGYEGLKKFYHSYLNTRVDMVSSTKTVSPEIVVCPAYWPAYKMEDMNKAGIKDRNDYKNSNINGNDSSIDARVLFNKITNNLTEILNDVAILFKTGKYVRHKVFHNHLCLINHILEFQGPMGPSF